MELKYAKPLFIGQIEEEKLATTYDAGIVCKQGEDFLIGYEMKGAEETFSIGQPVYDKDGNIMGWLGIGLFENLNYSAKVRVPCEYWQICLPTKFCEAGKQVYTYWQMAEVEPQESDHKCHTCKHYTSGENDGSCGSYICKGYSNWESEDKE